MPHASRLTPRTYDIGIVGAGPAGATLARLLVDRYRVLLLDSGRPKCCGGILSPEAQKMLARLGLALPKTVLVDPQPFAVAIFDADNNRSRKYSRQYVNIDRLAFDQWTLSLLPPSVDRRCNALYRFAERQNDGIIVNFTENNAERTERVRFLVGADGANSAVRREFFSQRPVPKRYLAVQDWFAPDAVRVESNADFRNAYVGIFDREFTDFYCWTIPKNESLIVGGAFPPGSDIRPRFERFKKTLEAYGLFLGEATRREAGMIFRPGSRTTICPGSDRVFLVGEAAGLISPSSAEGISTAFASAVALAQAIEGKNATKQYRRNLRSLIWGVFRKNVKGFAMFSPCLRNWILQSGLLSLE